VRAYTKCGTGRKGIQTRDYEPKPLGQFEIVIPASIKFEGFSEYSQSSIGGVTFIDGGGEWISA